MLISRGQILWFRFSLQSSTIISQHIQFKLSQKSSVETTKCKSLQTNVYFV